MYVEYDHRIWDVHLHNFKHAINTVVESSMKVLSAFLNYVSIWDQPQIGTNNSIQSFFMKEIACKIKKTKKIYIIIDNYFLPN